MIRAHRWPRPFDVARRTLALILVVALSSGCSSMRPADVRPATELPEVPPGAHARLVMTSGERFDLRFLTVQGDSVRGIREFARENAQDDGTPEQRMVVYAIADVKEIQETQLDKSARATVVLCVGIVAAAAALLIVNSFRKFTLTGDSK